MNDIDSALSVQNLNKTYVRNDCDHLDSNYVCVVSAVP